MQIDLQSLALHDLKYKTKTIYKMQVIEENKGSKVSRGRKRDMNVCDQKRCDVLQTNRAPAIM